MCPGAPLFSVQLLVFKECEGQIPPDSLETINYLGTLGPAGIHPYINTVLIKNRSTIVRPQHYLFLKQTLLMNATTSNSPLLAPYFHYSSSFSFFGFTLSPNMFINPNPSDTIPVFPCTRPAHTPFPVSHGGNARPKMSVS